MMLWGMVRRSRLQLVAGLLLVTFFFYIRETLRYSHVSYDSKEGKSVLGGAAVEANVIRLKVPKLAKEANYTSNPVPYQAKVLLSPPDFCQEKQFKYIIYIHTATANVHKRNRLRNTWGNTQLLQQYDAGLVFLLGLASDPQHNQMIANEFEQYGDIVQGDFIDSYRNLTLKGIMGLKWVSTHCHSFTYLIKTDDDAFINVFELFKFLGQYESQKRMVACPLWRRMHIARDPAVCRKWCVKPNEFPGMNVYPQYCAGINYVMTQDLVREMHAASLRTPFFWIDDVYITGLLPRKVKDVRYVDTMKHFWAHTNWALEEYQSSRPIEHFIVLTARDADFHVLWNSTRRRLAATTPLTV